MNYYLYDKISIECNEYNDIRNISSIIKFNENEFLINRKFIILHNIINISKKYINHNITIFINKRHLDILNQYHFELNNDNKIMEFKNR
jgi:hypothetical protein